MAGLWPVVMLTDFGWTEYVGVMKGVLASRAPGVQVIDLTHGISPQGVREGAWLLEQTYHWFPQGSIFLCVVDPGVGSSRRAIAVETESYFFVGPDNGLMFPAIQRDGPVKAVELDISETASKTFHGRDVFAQAAAALAAGNDLGKIRRRLAKLGRAIDPASLVSLYFHREGSEGEIVRIDRFGNCITNIVRQEGDERTTYTVTIEGAGENGAAGELRPGHPSVTEERLALMETYDAAPDGTLFLIENAYGTLEIACKNDSAQERIQTEVGRRVRIE